MVWLKRRETLNKRDLQKFKDLLNAERRKVATDLKHLENESLNTSQKDASGDLSGYSFHMADVATDNYDREFNLDLASNEQKLVNSIDDALVRVEDGTYGKCEACEKKIPVERLKIVPYAKMCISCQEEEEKKNRRRAQ